MKKIALSYGIFTILYYLIISIIHFSSKKVGNNLLESLLILLGDLFFWITVHAYFAMAVFISSIIGMFVSKYKIDSDAFKGFRLICIIIVVLVLIMVIISNL